MLRKIFRLGMKGDIGAIEGAGLKVTCFCIGLVFVICSGCTHPMYIKNLEEFQVIPTSGTCIDVALAPHKESDNGILFFRAVEAALRTHPHVASVRTNWASDKTEYRFAPTHIISTNIVAEYRGSGWNFPITFPGFLIFTCAWNGYINHIDITTDITAIPLPNTKKVLEDSGWEVTTKSESLYTSFNLRYCDFSRGFWSGTGWWFPGWGLHNIITGAIFIGYDEDATRPFHYEGDKTYGEYVAESIVRLLRTCGAAKYKNMVTTKGR